MTQFIVTLPDGSTNTIVADEAFVEANYPGAWELAPEPETPPAQPAAPPHINWPSMGAPSPIEITSTTPFFTGD